MGLQPVNFWTPLKFLIKYKDTLPLIYQLTIVIDAYFNLTCRVAVIIPNAKENQSQGCILRTHPIVPWQKRIKIASYLAPFVLPILTAQIPRLRNHILSQLISTFPIVMLIAKIALRSFQKFHILPQDFLIFRDLIKPEVKTTLHTLLGDAGPVDKLPIYRKNDPDENEMPASIMRGRTEKYAFILIRLQCISPQNIIQEKLKDVPLNQEGLEGDLNRTVYLYQPHIETPLAWYQTKSSYQIYPHFFGEESFTYVETGEVKESQTENFKLLQNLIKNGKGVDAQGFEWEIVK